MAKSNGHSKSITYTNHAKTGTDIPSGYEYIAEQIKDAKHYVKALNSWTHAVSTKGMSRDRGAAINELNPSEDFEGMKSTYEWMQKQDSAPYRKVWEGGPPKYKNPKRIS